MKPLLSCIVIFTVLLVSGCDSNPPPVPTQPARQGAEIESARTERKTAWGKGRDFPAGEHTLPLGTAPERSVFRIALLEDWEEPAQVRAQLRVGETVLGTFASAGKEHWTFATANLADKTGEPCALWLECARPFVLGVCEFVHGKQEKPNILVFLIDTLRRDHVSCYGYERETTPHIDQLRADGVLIARLMPQSSWTRPSVASLLTGTYPSTHGAESSLDRVRENLPRLAAALHDFGYETHGYVSNPHCLPVWNLGSEFDVYTDVDSDNWRQADDARLVDRFLEVLPSLAGRPWFAYIHAMGPHGPYDPPGGFETRFQPEAYTGSATEIMRQKAVDLYDAEIAYTDAQFARVMEALKREGSYDDTAIIVLADHGEEFWEHGGTDHGKTLYEEQLRVPLIWKLPGGRLAGESRDALVEMVDIAPTLLEMVEAPSDPRFQGRSLWPYLLGGEIAPAIGFASLKLHNADLLAAKTIGEKCIHDRVANNTFWYDLAADPVEQSALPAAPPWSEALSNQMELLELRGRNGLHIFVTREPGTSCRLRCQIEASELGMYRVFFPGERGGAYRSDAGVVFELHMKDREDAAPAGAWPSLLENDSAHLFVEMAAGAPVAVRITRDDATVEPESIQVGNARTSMALEGTLLYPDAIESTWAAMQSAESRPSFAVYVWYEAGATRARRQELDPEMLEALRGHGYLGD